MNTDADMNIYGYRIVSCFDNKTASPCAAAFKYRGHTVSMSTYYRWGEKVLVIDNATKEESTFDSVEEAITTIDKRLMGVR